MKTAPLVTLDPDTIEATPCYEYHSTLCVGITFRDAQSPRRAPGASIAMLRPRPDLDGDEWSPWRDGWHWYDDTERRELIYQLAPTERELYEALWQLQSQSVAREHWLQRVAQWDQVDRDEWIREQLSIGASLAPHATLIAHADLRDELARIKRRLAELLRDQLAEDR